MFELRSKRAMFIEANIKLNAKLEKERKREHEWDISLTININLSDNTFE